MIVGTNIPIHFRNSGRHVLSVLGNRIRAERNPVE